MKPVKITALVAILLAAFISTFGYEWRYSGDLQDYISLVNRDLESARLGATYATGLIGSLQALTAASEVGGEIISTHDHVHTFKDQVLAWKIKKAIGQSVTVGEAIQSVIGSWPESI